MNYLIAFYSAQVAAVSGAATIASATYDMVKGGATSTCTKTLGVVTLGAAAALAVSASSVIKQQSASRS